MKNEREQLIVQFIEDYNALLEGLNDELEPLGISNKLIKKLSEVEIDNLECDEYLYELYNEIKNK